MNLFTRLFRRQPPAPAVPPEPSCFIKGVAKSLREGTDDEWVAEPCPSLWDKGWDAALRHRSLEVTIWMGWRVTRDTYSRPYAGCTAIRRVSITHLACEHEEIVLAQALEARPRGAFKVYLDGLKAADERRQSTHDHFTNLGCPPS